MVKSLSGLGVEVSVQDKTKRRYFINTKKILKYIYLSITYIHTDTHIHTEENEPYCKNSSHNKGQSHQERKIMKHHIELYYSITTNYGMIYQLKEFTTITRTLLTYKRKATKIQRDRKVSWTIIR